ncbi:uncharacterized protein PV09_09622 [Verruconis gallopava]|uniref:Small ribosomal subunit protein mS35 mitochondrial conserved domain-containing protein n=1 Tax=Verruconis gallopava TaxID=253628 RepID=A0A0D2AI50_9PEZI|nr:uncharacterized protein PV09_09622 [Verruconis gallopava]KIV98588.1 hypothetical protein PV09_09622 [Verruconis gallopava]
MSPTAGRLVSTSYLQIISSTSRCRMRVGRLHPVRRPKQSAIWSNHQTFTTSRLLLYEESEKLIREPLSKALPAESYEIDKSNTVHDDIASANAFDDRDLDAVEPTSPMEEANGVTSFSATRERTSIRNVTGTHVDVERATILAHGESESRRDLKEYAKLAAWELPLLHKLRQPFQPPSSATPLRFRYTSYMGEDHPAAKKVTVEFNPSELPNLNEEQQVKLIKLVGARYNPEKKTIKMSCESFATSAQNKRYLGDLLQKLVQEARNSKDMFSDVPIDLRHHVQKPVYNFPEEWKISPPVRIVNGKGMRGKGLQKRGRLQELQEGGHVVDGVKIIREAMAALPLQKIRPQSGGKTVLGSGKIKVSAKGKLRTAPGTT